MSLENVIKQALALTEQQLFFSSHWTAVIL